MCARREAVRGTDGAAVGGPTCFVVAAAEVLPHRLCRHLLRRCVPVHWLDGAALQPQCSLAGPGGHGLDGMMRVRSAENFEVSRATSITAYTVGINGPGMADGVRHMATPLRHRLTSNTFAALPVLEPCTTSPPSPVRMMVQIGTNRTRNPRDGSRRFPWRRPKQTVAKSRPAPAAHHSCCNPQSAGSPWL